MPPRAARGQPAARLRLAFVSSELAPIVQTGGLGEAVAGLARALAARGHELHCIVPAHSAALQQASALELRDGGPIRLDLAGDPLDGRWHTGHLGPLTLHLLELSDLFARDAIYGGLDEGYRFTAFSRAAAARCAELAPHVMVAHDWQAALSICILRTLHDRGPGRGIGTVQVVHNNAYQGRFEAGLLEVAGLPGEFFAPDGLEFYGQISLLKGGLGWADRIVAVSPSYAEELQTAEFGAGLEGLYRYRAGRLTGIVNGIDADAYDPDKDAALPAQFSAQATSGRAQCREALGQELGLETPKPGWLLACVGRLAAQKGWDVLADAAPALVERGASLALLGDGEPELRKRIATLARRWPERIAFQTGWNDGLARRIYAGSDALLIPSRFEPCGLVQRLAQRYGSLPIAHAVGGLRDTIRSFETGILFQELTAEALVEAATQGAALQRQHGDNLTRTLLSEDVSWREPVAAWERELADVAADAAARM